jgi:TetR/AcrR family transcriptional regulator, regulator of cefoperazone and chloramphenicol sensitivity
MRTVEALDRDLTAKARIRDSAMRLLGSRGVAATSLRSVAKVAGVSPALVIHHFGSKDGLLKAVDEAVVERIELALSEVPLEGPGGDLLEARGVAVAALLERESALFDYLGRALSEDTEASAALFHRLFGSARRDGKLVKAGAIRAEADPFWRAMHQLVLIVGPLMLRRLIERELGAPLLEEPQLRRWIGANRDLLRNGLYR